MESRCLFDPAEILPKFDEFLAAHNENFEAVLVGAGALKILGVVDRRTVDFDILDPKIPVQIERLAEEFRKKIMKDGLKLEKLWLNNGPASLLNSLPSDWAIRTQLVYRGKALTFYTLGRPELLKDKLWGFCDLRDHDMEALLNLKPSVDELKEAAEWVRKQEANPGWPAHVEKRVAHLSRELGYE